MQTETGQHLIMDLHGVTSLTERSGHDLYRFLAELPAAIGMQAIGAPQLVYLENEPGSTPGISGFIILAESHLSFHTWPEREYVSLDLYSCRSFDTDLARTKIRAFWEPTGEVTEQVLART